MPLSEFLKRPFPLVKRSMVPPNHRVAWGSGGMAPEPGEPVVDVTQFIADFLSGELGIEDPRLPYLVNEALQLPRYCASEVTKAYEATLAPTIDPTQAKSIPRVTNCKARNHDWRNMYEWAWPPYRAICLKCGLKSKARAKAKDMQ